MSTLIIDLDLQKRLLLFLREQGGDPRSGGVSEASTKSQPEEGGDGVHST